MSETSNFDQIFRTGSRTFFYSSLFFPPEIKQDVFELYAFVRTADNYVDRVPAQSHGLESFHAHYLKATHGEISGNPVVDQFVKLSRKRNFDPLWIDAFFDSMMSDLVPVPCATLDDTLKYIYGSAEVVGLMMCKILSLPEIAYPAARALGKAYQYINFIRDIAEDLSLGRQYLPTDHLRQFGLTSLNQAETRHHADAFQKLMLFELELFDEWLNQGEQGYQYIPRRYRIPIATASAMYAWTGKQIRQNPFVVYERKVKPSTLRVVTSGLKHLLT